MTKLLAIRQIKCRRKPDFWMWLKWYCLYLKCDKILIIDDDSPVKIKDTVNEFNGQYSHGTAITVVPAAAFEGAPSTQCRQIRNANIGMAMLAPANGDIVITPDDDEFWWYDQSKHKSFTAATEAEFTRLNTDCITLPWIMMSSESPMKSRPSDSAYADCFEYAAPLIDNEVKFIIRYNGLSIDAIHTGITAHAKLICGGPMVTATRAHRAFATATNPIRLYHFNITTEEEFNLKMSRNINDKNHKRFFLGNKTFHDFNKRTHDDFRGYTVHDKTIVDTLNATLASFN